MSSKSSGSIDTSGIEAATNRAIDIQQENYQDILGYTEPYYNLGTQAVGTLADYLGLSGGSMQSREDIYQSLLPEYTTTTTSTTGGAGTGAGGLWGYGGTVYDSQEAAQAALAQAQMANDAGQMQGIGNIYEVAPASTTTTNDITDYTGLNAAVDAAYAAQETPEYYGSLLQTFGADQFEEDAGYQYRQQEAQDALARQMAAQGVTLGGGGVGEINPQVYEAMNEMTQGIASDEYADAYNRYVNDQANIYNMLAGTAGIGQNATNTMTAAATGTADAISGLTTSLASSQLNAQLAEASQPSMFDTLLNAGTTLGSAYLMSDVRLKDNIKDAGTKDGHKLYEFDYKDGSGRFRGVMAQDVQAYMPEAVIEMPNGYLAVDYGKLGIDMEAV